MRAETANGDGGGGAARRIAGVLGELLITCGLIVLLFVAWELWWTNLEADRKQHAATSALVQQFDDVPSARPPAGTADPGASSKADREEFGAPPAARLDLDGATFAVMYIPRFGEDFARPVTNGVGLDVLNNLGIGHYPSTQLPGEKGNFAVAAHRQTHGQVFYDIDKLGAGDRIYVQTREGFYTYAYRSTEIVHPTSSEVLLPVPHRPGTEPTTSILTLTSCDPPFSTAMRIIAYAELESWRPASSGPPAAIADAVAHTVAG
ncbi:MAG: class E sortase [Arthrobacter sp.]|uniref:class E sortase n=1 Tax=Arthrobacter sp. TaxID=1667 RepID=UPI0034971278